MGHGWNIRSNLPQYILFYEKKIGESVRGENDNDWVFNQSIDAN